MEQNFQTSKNEEGFTLDLIDICKMLLSKLRLLILVLIAGAIVGCALGVATTYNVNYYGTKLQYYVNPKRSPSSTENQSQYGVYGAYGKNVMDNMVELLSSERFAENLLLDDDGLPREWLNSDRREEARKIIQASKEAIKEVENLTEESEDLEQRIPDLQAEYNYCNEDYEFFKEARRYEQERLSNARAAGFSQSIIAQIEADVEDAKAKEIEAGEKRATAREDLKNAKDRKSALEKEIKDADEYALKLIKQSDDALEEILQDWRKTDSYHQQLSLIKSSVSYSYLKESSSSSSNANDFARSFFYVEIVMLNNKEFSEFLLERIKEEMPLYIEANMAIPAGYEATNCALTTCVDSIRELNPDLMKNQAIKYGALFAVAALVVVCVILILVDNADKKLRDYDVLTQVLNLPILGVIPSIEMMESETVSNIKKSTKED